MSATQHYVDIFANDNSGTFAAYIAYPAQMPAPAIVVIQEIFGINADMRAKCDELAKQGYVAICPDLFWRIEPGVDLTDQTQAEWDQAFALLNAFDLDNGVDDLAATADYIRNNQSVCNGKVGAVGYCLGGKLAYLMAARTKIDASVGYYGIELDKFKNEAANITCPTLLHMAELDKFFPADARNEALEHFAQFPHITSHVYNGVDHAFARINGDHYDRTAAELANSRTDAFFVETLKG